MDLTEELDLLLVLLQASALELLPRMSPASGMRIDT
jgi:hypothetical protein